MTQLAARVDEQLVHDIDQLVAEGLLVNRSEAVRVGLERLVDVYRRQRIGQQIADAYTQHPQTSQELAGLDAGTRALVEEEPW